MIQDENQNRSRRKRRSLQVFGNNSSEGFLRNSNVTRLDRLNRLDVQDGADIGTCNLIALLPFTLSDMGFTRGSHQSAIAIWLAMQHLNNGDGSIVPQVDGLNERCNVRFTAEFLDTEYRSGPALRNVVQRINEFQNLPTDLVEEDESEISQIIKPRPCGFIGPSRSVLSQVTSAVTGLEGYVQVSGASTSTDLDDTDSYPLFARTVPSDAGTAEAILLYLIKELEIQHLVILNDDDSFANSYASNLRNYISRNDDIHLNITQVTADKDGTDVVHAVRTIKNSQLRYIFAIKVYDDGLDELMEEAVRQGIAGNGNYTWIFADGISSSTIASKNLTRGSPLHQAYVGSGMIVASGSSPENKAYPRFLAQLRSLQNNNAEMDNLKAVLPHDFIIKTPENNTEFWNATDILHDERLFEGDRVLGSLPFRYEAAILLGLGACAATTDSLYLTGGSHYGAMLQTSFDGISGNVVLDPETGTRLGNSSYFKVINFKEGESDPNSQTLQLRAVETHFTSNGIWHQRENFTYSNGATERPPDLPQLSVHYNDVDTPVRVIALLFCGFSILLALVCAAWTFLERKKPIVLASQPAFLYLICTGTATFASSIIPLTFDLNNASIESMTHMCTSAVWLLCIGAALTLSALYSKTRRINVIMANAQKFRRVKVTVKSTLLPIFVFLLMNIALLAAMTGASPIPFVRVPVSYDIFGRESEFYGRCELSQSAAYTAPLAVLNFGMLCLAIFQAWRARELSTEYQESEYIFRALWVIFLAVFIGLPVLIISKDNPDASVFLSSAIIAVSSCAIVSLIFVPKIKYVRNAELGDKKVRVRITGVEQSGLSNLSSGNGMPYFNTSSNSSDSEEDYGDRIITTKTKRQLVEEKAALKRRIHVLEGRLEQYTDDTPSPDNCANIEEATQHKEEDHGTDEEKNV